uniref:Uncharacterized protein n=1 Tax=Rhizophora mucronata TaxID=61149 RepID=A0A2P2N8J8_RHIMU
MRTGQGGQSIFLLTKGLL